VADFALKSPPAREEKANLQNAPRGQIRPGRAAGNGAGARAAAVDAFAVPRCTECGARVLEDDTVGAWTCMRCRRKGHFAIAPNGWRVRVVA
jgi:hypothetical protein